MEDAIDELLESTFRWNYGTRKLEDTQQENKTKTKSKSVYGGFSSDNLNTTIRPRKTKSRCNRLDPRPLQTTEVFIVSMNLKVRSKLANARSNYRI